MNDRARDNWEPLLAIAEACGGDWPARARDAALRLSGIDEDETLGIQLLEDLQWLFSLNNCEQLGHGLSSGDIATTSRASSKGCSGAICPSQPRHPLKFRITRRFKGLPGTAASEAMSAFSGDFVLLSS